MKREKRNKMKVIVSHMNIDFDGLACLLAAKKLYPEAAVALTDKQQATVKSFLAIYRDQLNFFSYEQIQWSELTSLILVDVASLKRTGIPIEELPPTFDTIIYDHHSPKDGDVQTGERYVEDVGAAVTILIEELLHANADISSFEATLFGLGLYTDTGNFTYPQVTARDLTAAAHMREHGMDVTLIENFSEKVLSSDEKDLLHKLLQNGEEQIIHGVTIFLTSYEQDIYQGGVATLAEKIMDTTDVDAVIVVIKMKKDIHVVTRASSTRIDFRPLVESLGGGGHAQAASATIKKAHLQTVYAYVEKNIEHIVTPALTARSLMTSPVKSVLPTAKIDEVLKQMFQFGHTGFPVVDENEKLLGVISRRDVDKATHHGLGHAPVKAYMSRQPITLPANASLEEIQSTMMQHNIGRIPIIENGKMVGILTRTDVIEQLHQHSKKEDEVEITSMQMLEKMEALLPSETFQLLKQVGALADQQKLDIYLIGGIVRDFFLNRQNEDIDLVVEGDGIAFAKLLAAKLGGEVKTHDSFGTATWETPINVSVDVVTCRTEYYDAPGQLPIVRASNIREDLRRRDFTINAMALRINERHFGEVLDYFQGVKDIESKTIRILHSLSFIEDPTRIFRAVRFALRFNYQLDQQTKELAINAASMLKQISPTRLYRELNLIINEGFCINGMKMLDQLHVFAALFDVTPTKKAWERLRRFILHDVINPFISLLALLYGENDWQKRLAPYAFTADQRKLIDQLIQLEAQPITNQHSHGQLHQHLYSFSDEVLQLFAVLTEQEYMIAYVQTRKRTMPLLTGNDLIELELKPGPHFSTLLLKLASLQLDNKITTKAEAIDWLLTEMNHDTNNK